MRQLYEQTLAERGYTSDPAQLRAVDALERCENEWADYKARRGNALTKLIARPPIPRGVYMYGGVGRGKSFLMDCFFNAVPLQRKTRLHFHEFMREVHRELAELQGHRQPAEELGRRIARRYRLICFDEFHVADVTDAMILHRLLEALFENRVSIVTTSNFQPDELYPNGLHRDRILPAIELLKDKLEVVNVDAGIDYRQPHAASRSGCTTRRSAPRPMRRWTQAFERLAEAQGRGPGAAHRAPRAARAAPRRRRRLVRLQGAVRRAALAERLPRTRHAVPHACCCPDVPQMSPRLASEARRFTWLVDVLYDRRVKLILSAEVPAEQLYTEGPLAHEFPRTVSRLPRCSRPSSWRSRGATSILR